MTEKEIKSLLDSQRAYYKSGATLPVDFRIQQLKKLYAAVRKYEKEINYALKTDLGKSAYESFMCESGFVLTEISYLIRHTRELAKRRTVRTPLAQFCSHSFKQPIPYGNTLIMSPWNYPFLLTIEPLADAIAAGNTAIVKPSAYSPATSAIVEKIVGECFSPEYVAVVTGGREEKNREYVCPQGLRPEKRKRGRYDHGNSKGGFRKAESPERKLFSRGQSQTYGVRRGRGPLGQAYGQRYSLRGNVRKGWHQKAYGQLCQAH